MAKLGLTFPVVLQKEWEVSMRCGMFGTPIGYLIDEQGTIAADVAEGMQAMVALVSGMPTNDQVKTQPEEDIAQTAKR